MSDKTLLEKVAQRLSTGEEVALSDLPREETQTLAWSGLATGMLDKEASVKVAGFWKNLLRTEVASAKKGVEGARAHAATVSGQESKGYARKWWGGKRSPEELEAALKKAKDKGKLKKTDAALKDLEQAEQLLWAAKGQANKTLAGTAAATVAGGAGVATGKKLIEERRKKIYGDYA
jgi:hypothetical protein